MKGQGQSNAWNVDPGAPFERWPRPRRVACGADPLTERLLPSSNLSLRPPLPPALHLSLSSPSLSGPEPLRTVPQRNCNSVRKICRPCPPRAESDSAAVERPVSGALWRLWGALPHSDHTMTPLSCRCVPHSRARGQMAGHDLLCTGWGWEVRVAPGVGGPAVTGTSQPYSLCHHPIIAH